MSESSQNRRLRRRSYATKGLCASCGTRPRRAHRSRCEVCTESRSSYWKRRYDALVLAGLCSRCGKSQKRVHLLCLDCWFRNTANNNCGTPTKWVALRDLWERQDGRCAYTGELLVPGETASVDHRIPVARGGTDDIDNLQWVSWKANQMKGELTHDEFVSVCVLVSSTVGA